MVLCYGSPRKLTLAFMNMSYELGNVGNHGSVCVHRHVCDSYSEDGCGCDYLTVGVCTYMSKNRECVNVCVCR